MSQGEGTVGRDDSTGVLETAAVEHEIGGCIGRGADAAVGSARSEGVRGEGAAAQSENAVEAAGVVIGELARAGFGDRIGSRNGSGGEKSVALHIECGTARERDRADGDPAGARGGVRTAHDREGVGPDGKSAEGVRHARPRRDPVGSDRGIAAHGGVAVVGETRVVGQLQVTARESKRSGSKRSCAGGRAQDAGADSCRAGESIDTRERDGANA